MSVGRGVTDYIETVLMRFGIKFSNLLFFLLVANYLDLNDIAIYGLFFSMSLLISVVIDLGQRNTMARLVGEFPSERNTYFYSSNLLFFVIVFLFSIILFSLIFNDYLQKLNTVIIPFYIVCVSMAYIRTMQGFLLGEGRIKDFNISEAIPRFFLLFAIGVFWVGGELKLTWACWSLALAQFAGALYIGWRMFSEANGRVVFVDKKVMVKVIFIGSVFMISVLAMNFSKQLHFYALDYYAQGLSGFYFTMFRLSEIATEIALGISVVVFARATQEKNELESLKRISRVVRLTMATFLPVLVVVYFCRNLMVTAFLDQEYTRFGFEFFLICVGSYLGIIWAVIFPAFSVIFHPLKLGGAFLGSITFSILIYKYFLIVGVDLTIKNAAYVFIFSTLIANIVLLLLARYEFGVKFSEFLVPNTDDLKFIRSRIQR